MKKSYVKRDRIQDSWNRMKRGIIHRCHRRRCIEDDGAEIEYILLVQRPHLPFAKLWYIYSAANRCTTTRHLQMSSSAYLDKYQHLMDARTSTIKIPNQNAIIDLIIQYTQLDHTMYTYMNTYRETPMFDFVQFIECNWTHWSNSKFVVTVGRNINS